MKTASLILSLCLCCCALVLLCLSCSLKTEGFTDLLTDTREHPEELTQDDLDSFDWAARNWCEQTCGACCPEGYSVALIDEPSTSGQISAYWSDRDQTAYMSTAITTEADWYSFALLLLGVSCGVPESDHPGDAMCASSRANHITAHDVELAGGLCGGS